MSTDLHVAPTALPVPVEPIFPEEEKQSLQTQGRSLREQVAAVVILSADDYTRCAAWTLAIVENRRKIAERLDAGVKSAYDAYKFVYDLRAELDAPFKTAEEQLSRKLAAWQSQEKARVAEIARRQREEEQAKARQERERLEALRREADRKERERLREEQETRFLEEAAKREREGDRESAQLILAAATELPPPSPPRSRPRARWRRSRWWPRRRFPSSTASASAPTGSGR